MSAGRQYGMRDGPAWVVLACIVLLVLFVLYSCVGGVT